MIEVFSISEAGGHVENEDAFIVEQHPGDPACWLCTLADGQGGRAGGGRAAKIAAQLLPVLAKKQHSSQLVDTWLWANLFRSADRLVAKDSQAGFTTLIGLCVLKERVIGGSNGDSAVAIFDATRECLELTKHQEKNPPVGSGDATFTAFATNLHRPWMILVMSDGVWKYARWEKIIEAAKTLRGQELIGAIKQSAMLTRTGKLQDDFTLVILQSEAN
jgi:PPM family protein phosphatase